MTDVRALTIKRPWADLIVHHGKDVENRSWATSYRGTLFIHAGQGWDGAAEAWFNHVFAPFVPDGYWKPQEHPQGIIAVAELVNVCQGKPCECGPWAMQAAAAALADILTTGGLGRLFAPCRTYRCPGCRRWHLTSKPAWRQGTRS